MCRHWNFSDQNTFWSHDSSEKFFHRGYRKYRCCGENVGPERITWIIPPVQGVGLHIKNAEYLHLEMSIYMQNHITRVSIPGPFVIPGNSWISKTDSCAPRNGAMYRPVAVLTLSDGGRCWSVWHATRYDWWQALPTTVPLYKFIHYCNPDNSRTSCQSLAFTLNTVGAVWESRM